MRLEEANAFNAAVTAENTGIETSTTNARVRSQFLACQIRGETFGVVTLEQAKSRITED